MSAQTLIIGTPLTVAYGDWSVGASNGASCTFTYAFTKTGGPAVILGTPTSNTIRVVDLSQNTLQDEGITFDI